MPCLDRDALLAFAAEREGTTRDPLVQSVYYALGERIRRGDFDREEPAR